MFICINFMKEKTEGNKIKVMFIIQKLNKFAFHSENNFVIEQITFWE